MEGILKMLNREGKRRARLKKFDIIDTLYLEDCTISTFAILA